MLSCCQNSFDDYDHKPRWPLPGIEIWIVPRKPSLLEEKRCSLECNLTLQAYCLGRFRLFVDPSTLGASSHSAVYTASSMIGAAVLIAGIAVPNQSGIAASSPSPVTVSTPNPNARQAPLIPQPTAGSVVTTEAPRAILFHSLASRIFSRAQQGLPED